MATFDLVIRGGAVADGSGGSLRTADVAIDDGLIVAVGKVDGSARREIDADGAVIAPGWVDIHTHYDGQAVWDSSLTPSSNQGVTTTVFGNCGVGFAPARTVEQNTLVELMEGVEDLPGTALHEGLTWEWETFPEYLDALERRPHDIDYATQVPHAAVRVYAMGERGVNGELATPREIERMSELVQEGIEAGALGFSTSRSINHRSSTGGYTPSLRATEAELNGIGAGLRRAGRGVMQLVSDFEDLDVEWPIILSMARASGRPVSMTVLERFVFAPTADSATGSDVLDRISAARASGLELSAQVAPRAIGLTMGLATTLNPFMACPPWQDLNDLSLLEKVAALRSSEVRQRLLASYSGQIDEGKIGGSIISKFDRMVGLADPPNYEPTASDSVAAIAEREGRTAPEVALDMMLADEGRGLLYLPATNYAGWNLDAVRDMLVHPYAVPGLSDGGAHVSTICDASFPSFLLAHWGCRRETGRLPIEFLIERQTRACAELVGLRDRGVLAPGYRADINVIDLENLRVRRPELRWDLPAGGRRFVQHADGYLHSFVAGVETYRAGESTGALPGRLVRGSQPPPKR